MMTPEELAAAMNFPALPDRLSRVAARAEEALRQPAPSMPAPAVLADVVPVGQALRAALTLGSAQLSGTFDDRIADAAAAIELVQTGSLVHDDIIDSAVTRRGRPTVVALHGVSTAIVVGDLLLATAARLALTVSGDTANDLVQVMARMAAGQLDEIADVEDLDRTEQRYLAATKAKTGALFAGACVIGATLSGNSERDRRALGIYGERFGTAYQIIDDVLDLTNDNDARGKDAAADLASGVYTLPVIRALKHPGGRTLRSLLRTRRPRDLTAAYDRLRRSPAIAEATQAAADLADKASAALKDLPPSALSDGLRRLPRIFLTAALEDAGGPPLPASRVRRSTPLRARPRSKNGGSH